MKNCFALAITHLTAETLANEILSMLAISTPPKVKPVKGDPSALLDLEDSTFVSMGSGVCRTLENTMNYEEKTFDLHQNNKSLCEAWCLADEDCQAYSWSRGKSRAASRCYLYSGQVAHNQLVPYMNVAGERTQAECFISAARGAEPCTVCESCGGAWGRSSGSMVLHQSRSRGVGCGGRMEQRFGGGREGDAIKFNLCCLGPPSTPVDVELSCILEKDVEGLLGVDYAVWNFDDKAGKVCAGKSPGSASYQEWKRMLDQLLFEPDCNDNSIMLTGFKHAVESSMRTYLSRRAGNHGIDDSRAGYGAWLISFEEYDGSHTIKGWDFDVLHSPNFEEYSEHFDVMVEQVNRISKSCLAVEFIARMPPLPPLKTPGTGPPPFPGSALAPPPGGFFP